METHGHPVPLRRPGAPARPHVVILGGGFGGLAAAKSLARADVRVTLIDRRNHHLFQPLVYQVATAGLSPCDVSKPLRAIFSRQANVEVMLAEARRVDLEGRRVELSSGSVDYDYLVVATGARHSYFGRDEWARHAPGLKTVGDALRIRERILHAFEKAEWTRDPAERERLLTFVVVGGGPTGVELAGAVSEIARRTMTRNFRHIDPSSARVVLVESKDRVLAAMPAPLPERALAQLHAIGVETRLGHAVTEVDERGIRVRGERIESATVLWAAGVRASPLGRALGAPLDRAGRVVVEEDCSLPGHPEVFVVGDLACFQHGRAQPLPGVAPVAMQMGRHVARSIVDDRKGRPRAPFRYRDKGAMATIGRSAAVSAVGKLRLWGLPAWLMWLVVHLLYLADYRSRLFVFFKWSLAYFTAERGSRLIWQSEPVEDEAAPPRPIAAPRVVAQPVAPAPPLDATARVFASRRRPVEAGTAPA